MTKVRAVCLNCMDGRVQLPVIQWIQDNCEVDYVDMVTEPGMNGLLADTNSSVEAIMQKVKLSIEVNNAKIIAAVGHDDCRKNSVDEAVHKKHIQQAIERLKKEFGDMRILGLWVNGEFKVEKVVG